MNVLGLIFEQERLVRGSVLQYLYYLTNIQLNDYAAILLQPKEIRYNIKVRVY